MEHTLGGRLNNQLAIFDLNPCFNGTYSRSVPKGTEEGQNEGLNPCFNGTYSRRTQKLLICSGQSSLNPCFNGTYSRSFSLASYVYVQNVLILVLMEHTLGGQMILAIKPKQEVLILVLMEHTLGE